MSEPTVRPQSQAGEAEPRKPFAAPVVQDLGTLPELTQQFGGTIGLMDDESGSALV